MIDYRILTAVFFFIASRAYIVFIRAPYLSDLQLYFLMAWNGIGNNTRAYLDFFYPYPPLSLPFVYLPYMIAPDYPDYRFAFHSMAFIFDAAVLYLLYRTAWEITAPRARKPVMPLVLYTVLGLFMADLIYDRLDIFVAFFCFAVMSLALTGKNKSACSAAAGGFLFKIMPALLLPLAVPAHVFKGGRVKMLAGAGLACAAALAPALVFLALYNYTVDSGLVKYLGEHSVRGIQVESVWASPFTLFKALGGDGVNIVTNYGAQHLSGDSVPALYLLLSKYAGFAALAVFYFFAYEGFRRAGKLSPLKLAEAFICAIMIIIASQRVLSVQFFVWAVPFLALSASLKKNLYFTGGVLLMYALTFYGFNPGYQHLLEGDLFFTGLNFIRNALLAVLTLYLVRDFFRSGESA